MDTYVDPFTRAFGALGEAAQSGLDVAAGCLRDIAELDELWRQLSVTGLLDDIGTYPGTQGTPGLLDAASALFGHEWGVEVPADRIVAVHGAFDGLAHALAGLPTGAVALVPSPGFDIHPPILRAGCVPLPLVWKVGSSVGELLAEVEHAATTRDVRALVLNLPRNPDGVTATETEWFDLMDLIRRFGMRLVLDDVYSFTGGRRPRELLESSDVVVVDSLSKRLGAPGLRAGFVVAPRNLMPVVRASFASSTIGLARPVAHVAERAIRFWLSQRLDVVVRRELHHRAAVLLAETPEWLRGQLLLQPGFMYAVLFVDDDRRVTRTLARAGLRVMPGSALGSAIVQSVRRDTSFVRLCLGATSHMSAVAKVLGHTLTDRDGSGVASTITQPGQISELSAHLPPAIGTG
ncbi:MAG: pyridoxal phosphate-dependent aminotransferase [Frankia sp.]